MSEEKREYLNSVILINFKILCLDSNGICVVKKFINTNKSEIIKQKIIEELKNNCLEIVQSPFGNYAIQHIFEEWGLESIILSIITNNIASLSLQKFSSNVVERILELADKVSKYYLFIN
jgi:hypothetical protein